MKSYNERLFKKYSFRGKLHLARFYWVQKQIKKYIISAESVLELGCFDGKVLNFINPPPVYYEGYDADWEGGLDLAEQKWGGYPQFHFYKCNRAATFAPKQVCNVSICMETLEHIPDEAELHSYLSAIALHTKTYFFITVPNEKGFFFLIKHITKYLLRGKDKYEPYTLKEVFYATIGKMDKVKREHHKGFDYDKLVNTLKLHFDIMKVEGLFKLLPASLNFSIGIVATPKKVV